MTTTGPDAPGGRLRLRLAGRAWVFGDSRCGQGDPSRVDLLPAVVAVGLVHGDDLDVRGAVFVDRLDAVPDASAVVCGHGAFPAALEG